MFELKVSSSKIEILKKDLLTSGRVGQQIKFIFSNEWNNLNKIIVFEAGNISRTITVLEEQEIYQIPWEVLECFDEELKCAVRGTSTDFKTIIPTIYINLGKIFRGADIRAGLTEELDPYPIDILPTKIKDIDELKEDVSVINEKDFKLTTTKKKESGQEYAIIPGTTTTHYQWARIDLSQIPKDYIEKYKNDLVIQVEVLFENRKSKTYHWECIQDTNRFYKYAYGYDTVPQYDKMHWSRPEYLEGKSGLLQAQLNISDEEWELGYKLIDRDYWIPAIKGAYINPPGKPGYWQYDADKYGIIGRNNNAKFRFSLLNKKTNILIHNKNTVEIHIDSPGGDSIYGNGKDSNIIVKDEYFNEWHITNRLNMKIK